MTKRQRTTRVRARKRTTPAPSPPIGLTQLSWLLGITEDEVLQLASAAALPWVYGSRVGVVIDGRDLATWLAASRRAHERQQDGDL